VIDDKNLADQVIAFVHRENPPPILFRLSSKEISLATDLRTDLRMLEERSEVMLEKFFREFSVRNVDFDLSRYFPPEGLWLLPSFKKPPTPTPLTIKMLVKAAKNNEWITEAIEME
jgi:hypothetical protein